MDCDDPPALGLSARFALVIAGLCGLLDVYDASERTAGPFVRLIKEILHRRLARFFALVARFHAGKLPVPRARASRLAPDEAGVAERIWDPMPRNRAWLWHLIPGMRPDLDVFESLLADPELAALLAATPQAGRLLRPIWRMMSPHPLPPILRAPTRSRPPRRAARARPASYRAPALVTQWSRRAEPPRAEQPSPRIDTPGSISRGRA